MIRRTAGFSTSSSPIGPASPGACVTMFSTPAGRPASLKISPQIRPPTIGDSSDGFSTTVLPSASGAAIERADRISAAFHGAIAPTTPTGLRMPIANVPGWSDGMIWPSGAYARRRRLAQQARHEAHLEHAEAEAARRSRARAAPTTSSRRGLEDVGGLQEDRLALRRRRLRPGGERVGRGLDRARRVLARAGGHERDDVAGERIEVVERAAPGGVDPLPADELLGLAYVRTGRSSRRLLSCGRLVSKRCDALSGCQGSVGGPPSRLSRHCSVNGTTRHASDRSVPFVKTVV